MLFLSGSLLFSLLISCTSDKETDTPEDTDTQQNQDTEDTDTEDTDTDDTDTEDTSVDTGDTEDTATDTSEEIGSIVALSIYDEEGNLVDGVPVYLGEMSGTTAQGLYDFQDVPIDTLLVLSAYPESAVDLHTNLVTSAGTTLEVSMVIPETQTSTVSQDGTDHSYAFTGLTVDIDGDISFVDSTGNPYPGAVNLRVATEMDPLSQPNPIDLDAFGDPLGCPPILTNFNVMSVTETGDHVQPTGTVSLSAPVLAYNTSQPVTLESFNPETGAWEQDSVASFDNGIMTADVSHFTQFRLVNGPRQEQGGMKVSIMDSSGSGQHAEEIIWECVDENGHRERGRYSGENIDEFCVMAPKDSSCYVAVDGKTTGNITLDNDCVCTADPETCEQVEIDISAAIECGNGILEEGENCDDGNTSGGDGCSSSCQPEGCFVEYSGGLNANAQYFSTPASCVFGYINTPSEVNGIAIYDVFFDASNFDYEASSDWADYASMGGSILGIAGFDPAYTLGSTNAIQLYEPVVLGHASVGTLAFDANNADIVMNAMDTSTMSFDMTINLNLTHAASSYPPPANDPSTGSFFDLGEANDQATLHVWGQYFVFPMQ